MKICLVCEQPRCAPLADFGELPVSHHFYDGSREEIRHPMVLGQCENCSQVQLLTIPPPEILIPWYDWLVNNEPESHLDDLVETLCGLPEITTASNILGISHKDESTLARFRGRGFANVRRIELGITNSRAGIETIQQRLQPESARRFREQYGPADLVIARHVLEHTHNPRAFMQALRELVNPTGYIVCEIPDCAAPFELLDYTVLWEEHSLYFSEATLRQCLMAGGFHIEAVQKYPAPYEIAIVAIARPAPVGESFAKTSAKSGPARAFAEAYPGRRQLLHTLLGEWRHDGKIALFGAGHHAAMFTNLLGTADQIEFVVDDNPHKRGLRMPGSRLPIVGSEELMAGQIKLCLSSLGAGSEQKVLQKLRGFLERGGAFASIFPTTPHAALTFLAE